MNSNDKDTISFIRNTYDFFINKQQTEPPFFDPATVNDEFAGTFTDRREFNKNENTAYTYLAEAYANSIKDLPNEEMVEAMKVFRDTCDVMLEWYQNKE